jgi:hypothetical protein
LKTSSAALWQLINTLTGPEKTFFKRNFSGAQAANKVYLRLFDAIASQKEYDEAAILKKFAPAISKKNISFQKHYLHTQVCDALVLCYSRNNIYQEIYKQIQLIRVFRKKGLLHEAHSTWKKTLVKARETESFAMLSLLKREFEKMILISGSDISYDELHSLFQKNLLSYDEYAGLVTLRDIYAELILIKRNAHFDISPADGQRIETLYTQVSYYDKENNSSSFWFRYYYHMCKGMLLYLRGDNTDALQHFKLLQGHWKQSPSFIQINGEHYLELLYMINYSGILNGAFDYVQKVFADPCNNLLDDTIQRANFQALQFVALNRIYNKTGRYNDVKKLLAAHKKYLPAWEQYLNADMNRTVNLSFSIASFVLEQYDDALTCARRAIDYYKAGVREEHHSVAQLLLLLITYCMQSSRLFDAQYRSTYGYFYKRKKTHPFEKAMIQCLHRSFYATDSKTKMNEYRKAIAVIEENKNDLVQKNIFSIFNFHGWLQSRVMRIPYHQYAEQKIKTGNMQPVL